MSSLPAAVRREKKQPARGSALRPREPSQGPATRAERLAHKDRGVISQPHLPLILGDPVAVHLVAGADTAREDRRVVAETDPALILGRRVAVDLVAGADCEDRGVVSQPNATIVPGGDIALDLIPGANGTGS